MKITLNLSDELILELDTFLLSAKKNKLFGTRASLYRRTPFIVEALKQALEQAQLNNAESLEERKQLEASQAKKEADELEQEENRDKLLSARSALALRLLKDGLHENEVRKRLADYDKENELLK